MATPNLRIITSLPKFRPQAPVWAHRRLPGNIKRSAEQAEPLAIIVGQLSLPSDFRRHPARKINRTIDSLPLFEQRWGRTFHVAASPNSFRASGSDLAIEPQCDRGPIGHPYV